MLLVGVYRYEKHWSHIYKLNHFQQQLPADRPSRPSTNLTHRLSQRPMVGYLAVGLFSGRFQRGVVGYRYEKHWARSYRFRPQQQLHSYKFRALQHPLGRRFRPSMYLTQRLA